MSVIKTPKCVYQDYPIYHRPTYAIITSSLGDYGGFLGPPQIQVRRCGNTSYSCRNAS